MRVADAAAIFLWCISIASHNDRYSRANVARLTDLMLCLFIHSSFSYIVELTTETSHLRAWVLLAPPLRRHRRGRKRPTSSSTLLIAGLVWRRIAGRRHRKFCWPQVVMPPFDGGRRQILDDKRFRSHALNGTPWVFRHPRIEIDAFESAETVPKTRSTDRQVARCCHAQRWLDPAWQRIRQIAQPP